MSFILSNWDTLGLLAENKEVFVEHSTTLQLVHQDLAFRHILLRLARNAPINPRIPGVPRAPAGDLNIPDFL